MPERRTVARQLPGRRTSSGLMTMDLGMGERYTGSPVVRASADAVGFAMPVVAVLVALDEEIEAFRGAHELEPVEEEGTPFPAFRFRVGAVDVVLMCTGVGRGSRPWSRSGRSIACGPTG